MTDQELIADLTERIDRAVEHLEVDAAHMYHSSVLTGKVMGLLLVKDWLRSYQNPRHLTQEELKYTRLREAEISKVLLLLDEKKNVVTQ